MIKNKSIVKNFFSLLFILIVSLNQTLFAVDFNENLGQYRIYSRIGNEKYIYYEGRLQTNYEYYYLDKNGNEMPAYCLELGVDGAETKDEYYVNVFEKINDEKLNMIMLNGYPYKCVNELGVANITEAKYATQFAIWAYLSNLDINKISATSTDYNRVVEAIRKIYNDGINLPYNGNNLVKMQNSKIDVDNIDKNYYSTNIYLEYNENVKEINIKIDGVEKYKITDELNNEISTLSGVQKFKILIPRNSILQYTKIDININYNTNQTAVMFGKSKIPNMQSVALTLHPVTVKNLYASLEAEYVPINFKLIKCDKENNSVKLSNVKFKIFNMDNRLLGEFITDKNGEINFDILKQFNIKNGEKIKIVEIETLDNYYIDQKQSTKIIEVDYDKENVVTFENEKIKGKIKIVKTSNDYNEFNNNQIGTYLKDATFEIYDENNNIIQEITTNEYGEAFSKELLKGKYYIKEKKAPEHYVLDDKVYEVEISENNEIVILNLKNNSQKKIELPKTGY